MSDYVEYLKEVLEGFGPIQVKRMFGGHGIFRDGLMFALVADETLYLKVDAESVAHFQDRNLQQFQFERRGKQVGMSYYTAPAEIFDDPDEATLWARRAYDAARRSASPTKPRPPKEPRSP